MWSSEARELAGAASRLTLGRVLQNQAVIRPGDIAVSYPGGELTFAELNLASSKLANTLVANGVSPGQRVAVLTENSAELCVLLYAAAKAGAVVAVLNWRLRPEEIAYSVDLVDAGILCSSAERAALLTETVPHLSTRPRLITLGSLTDRAETDSLFGLSADQSTDDPRIDVDPESILTLMYTSGTTGLPKAAAISHRALIARAGVMASELRLSRQDAFIGWAPMFHMVSTDYLFITHVYGGKFIVLPGFDAEAIAAHLERDRIGWFVLMPATIEPIIEVLIRRGSPVAGVRAVGAMADLVPPDQLRRLTEVLDAPYFNSFGSTEAGTVPSAGALLPAGVTPTHFAKVQTAFTDAVIADPDGHVADVETVGELLLRGPTMFSGYWNNDEATKEVFAGGWYHTGDLFKRAADGRLDFVSRSRYMIKSGGENIYPAEIERVFLQHPGVSEVVVVRRADDKWGEVPVAVVALSDPSISEADLERYCVERLAGYKRPKAIAIRPIADFPRNVTGKVMREALEQQVARR